MPIEQSALAAIRSELGQVLWDAPLYQGIFNVQLARAPTRVRFGFQTFWPCYARVEVYRMVTGELDLEHRLTCARAPFEDPKDDGGPIENLCSSGLLEAALLAGRKLVIDHHEPDGTGARCRTAGYRNP